MHQQKLTQYPVPNEDIYEGVDKKYDSLGYYFDWSHSVVWYIHFTSWVCERGFRSVEQRIGVLRRVISTSLQALVDHQHLRPVIGKHPQLYMMDGPTVSIATLGECVS